MLNVFYYLMDVAIDHMTANAYDIGRSDDYPEMRNVFGLWMWSACVLWKVNAYGPLMMSVFDLLRVNAYGPLIMSVCDLSRMNAGGPLIMSVCDLQTVSAYGPLMMSVCDLWKVSAYGPLMKNVCDLWTVSASGHIYIPLMVNANGLWMKNAGDLSHIHDPLIQNVCGLSRMIFGDHVMMTDVYCGNHNYLVYLFHVNVNGLSHIGLCNDQVSVNVYTLEIDIAPENFAYVMNDIYLGNNGHGNHGGVESFYVGHLVSCMRTLSPCNVHFQQ